MKQTVPTILALPFFLPSLRSVFITGLILMGLLFGIWTPVWSQIILLQEDFSTASGTTLPAGWTNDIRDGAFYDVWHFDNPGNRTINAPVAGTFAIFDSDDYSSGGGDEDVALVSPPFDASGMDILTLDFDMYFAGGYGGRIYIEVYDGSSWNLVSWTRYSSANAASVALDILSAANGATNAKVRFRWTGDFSWFWAIDNIVVTGQTLDDHDGDGIADEYDLDDDNDGIPDALEGFPTSCDDLIVYTGDENGNIYELDLQTGIASLKTTSSYVPDVINALSANPDQKLIYYGSGTMMYYWDTQTDQHGIVGDLNGQLTGYFESGGATFYDGHIYAATEDRVDFVHVDIYKIPVSADGKSFNGSPIALNVPASGGYGDIIYTTAGDSGTIYGSTTTGFYSFDIATSTYTNHGSDGNVYQLGATPDGSLWSSVGNTVRRINTVGQTFGAAYTLATQASDMTGPFACAQIEANYDQDGDGLPNSFDLDSDNDGIPDLIEAGGVDVDGNGLVDGIAGNGSLTLDADGDGWFDTYDNNNSNAEAYGNPSNMGNLDIDGDGLKNYFDLDSDGDGILDIAEANGTDSDGNGRIDDAVGDNGYSNSLDPADGGIPYLFAQGSGTYVKASTGLPDRYVDFDQDGIPNYWDVDADNDGILDQIEAQATGNASLQAYQLAALAVDSNGVSTTFASYQNYLSDHTANGSPTYGIQAYDHDQDGFPDYLDLDSDADGKTDRDEAWDTAYDTDQLCDYSACFVDVDQDGFLACFDADDSDAANIGYLQSPPDDNAYMSLPGGGAVTAAAITGLDGVSVLLYDVFPNNSGDDSEVQPDWRDNGCASLAAVQYPITESDARFENGAHVWKTPDQVEGVTRSYTYCDDLLEAGWRYYYDPLNPSQVLFAIQHGANTTEIEYVELRRDLSATRYQKVTRAGEYGSSKHPSALPAFLDLSGTFEGTLGGDSTVWRIQNPNPLPLVELGNIHIQYNWYAYDDYNGKGNPVASGKALTQTGINSLHTPAARSFKLEWYIQSFGINSALLGYQVINNSLEGYKIPPSVGSSFVMPRDWYVQTVNDNPLTAPVKVRFYYDPNDYAQTIDSAASFAGGNNSTVSSTVWFKVDKMFANDEIDPEKGLTDAPGYTLMDVESYGTEDGKTYVQFQNITGFSGGGMIVQTQPTLPVEWETISVEASSIGPLVKWTTLKEENVDYFQVERSIDGKLFNMILEHIPAQGRNGEGSAYQEHDIHLPNLPGIRHYFYRIKEIDKDGRQDHSPVVELTLDPLSSGQLSVYPNPTHSLVTLYYQFGAQEIQQASILNGLGQVMHKINPAKLVGRSEYQVDFGDWPEGIYFVKFETEQQTLTHKVVKY